MSFKIKVTAALACEREMIGHFNINYRAAGILHDAEPRLMEVMINYLPIANSTDGRKTVKKSLVKTNLKRENKIHGTIRSQNQNMLKIIISPYDATGRLISFFC